ncbi:MAG: tRNA (5-methylaminomethyl-2-thiouridine)(34)-methyltransferase MnmD [Bacteroidota bacterium]
MKRKIIVTADGSKTIQIEDWNEQYHSIHGAVQEAYHVFIKSGFWHVQTKEQPLRILEMGFGTGLNALITLYEAQIRDVPVEYVGIERFPVSLEEALQLEYTEMLQWFEYESVYRKMHEISWETVHQLTPNFGLMKCQQDFFEVNQSSLFNLVYFDAFGARVQPELWTVALFEKMYKALKLDGVLVTYSAKGSVRRALQEVGFVVERLPGPPGKREMLRATKKE